MMYVLANKHKKFMAKIYIAEAGLGNINSFREYSGHEDQIKAIAMAVNMAATDCERLLKSRVRALTSASIYDGKIVFTVADCGRKAQIIRRYAVDL